MSSPPRGWWSPGRRSAPVCARDETGPPRPGRPCLAARSRADPGVPRGRARAAAADRARGGAPGGRSCDGRGDCGSPGGVHGDVRGPGPRGIDRCGRSLSLDPAPGGSQRAARHLSSIVTAVLRMLFAFSSQPPRTFTRALPLHQAIIEAVQSHRPRRSRSCRPAAAGRYGEEVPSRGRYAKSTGAARLGLPTAAAGGPPDRKPEPNSPGAWARMSVRVDERQPIRESFVR